MAYNLNQERPYMDDINDRIKILKSYKTTNFCIAGSTLLFAISLIFWVFPQVNTVSEIAIYIYLIFNTLVSIFFLFKNGMPKVNINLTGQPEKFYKQQIDRTIISNEAGPFVYLFPLVFGMIFLFFIDLNNDQKLEPWFYVLFSLIILGNIIAHYKMRSLLRKEYKKIHGTNFFSFLKIAYNSLHFVGRNHIPLIKFTPE